MTLCISESDYAYNICMCNYKNNTKSLSHAHTTHHTHTHTHTHVRAHIQLKNMIAALHSSQQEGAKEFMRKGSHFGWDTIMCVQG